MHLYISYLNGYNLQKGDRSTVLRRDIKVMILTEDTTCWGNEFQIGTTREVKKYSRKSWRGMVVDWSLYEFPRVE